MDGVTGGGAEGADPSGRRRHAAASMPSESDGPHWAVVPDVIAATGGLLAVVVVAATTQDRLQVEASADLLGLVGTLLVAGGVVLNYFIDFVTADRRFPPTLNGEEPDMPYGGSAVVQMQPSAHQGRQGSSA